MLDTQVKHLPDSAPLALMLFQHVARDGFRGNPITGTVVAGSRESRSSSLLPSSGSFRSRSFFCLLPPLQRPSFLLLVFLLTPALKLTNERSASDQVLNWLPGIVLFTIPLLSHEPLPGAARPSHSRDLLHRVQSLVGVFEWCLRRAVRPRPLLLWWLVGFCRGGRLLLLLGRHHTDSDLARGRLS